jgi:hypothetical protein
MTRSSIKMTACAIAAAAFLSACGGGGTTPDTTPPTVTITDNVSGTANGDVTFTFTFSEVVTGFEASDVTVTNGTKGTFAMANDGRSATLVVSPTADSSGTIGVSIAAATFADSADNANTAIASANQAFDTTTDEPTPSTNLITNGDFNDGTAGWSGNAANVVTENGNSYFFADVAAAGNPWDANLSYVTNIPAADVNYKLTFKASSNRSRTLVAGIGLNQDPWTNQVQTVNLTTTEQTFVLDLTSNFSSPTSRIIFDMGADTGHVVIDDVKLEIVTSSETGNGGNGGGGSTTPGELLTFSSGFTSAALTASGGLVATSGGSNFDEWGGAPVNGWSGTFEGGAAADSYAGFYYQTPNAPTGLYSQMEVFGPNVSGLSTTGDTGGVSINGQTKVNFIFNQNPEWFNSTNNKFAVVLTLGKRYSIGTGCNIQLHGVKTPTAVTAAAYSMNLANEFRVAQDCGTGIQPDAVAQALEASPVISSVKVLGAGGPAAIIGRDGVTSGANLTTAVGGVYPTTVVLKGAITFD